MYVMRVCVRVINRPALHKQLSVGHHYTGFEQVRLHECLCVQYTALCYIQELRQELSISLTKHRQHACTYADERAHTQTSVHLSPSPRTHRALQ